MLGRKSLGAALVAGGGIAIYFGVQAYNSANDQLSRFFSGNPTQQTMILLGGGAVAVVVGLLALRGGGKPKK